MSFNDVAIVYVKESAYRIQFWYMSKNDATNIINNSNLVDKKGVLYFFVFLLCLKISNLTYYQRNRAVVVNSAKYYYDNDKERSRDHARDKYRNLSEEEKNKKREYGKKQIPQYVWRKKTKTKRISKRLSRG